MGDRSAIEWTDASWNPIRGCSRVSEGCRNCYAERISARLSRPGQPYERVAFFDDSGYTREARWTRVVELVTSALFLPLRWRRPRRIFVNSMSDLFHEKVPDEWIDRIFAVMALAPQHTFQVLTKRPERMQAYVAALDVKERIAVAMVRQPATGAGRARDVMSERVMWGNRLSGGYEPREVQPWPLPNVWLGVSVENQETADERISLLLETPAAVRFLSVEPLLESISIEEALGPVYRCSACKATSREAGTQAFEFCDDETISQRLGIDQVIVGGESGPGARPCDLAWIRFIVAQCKAAGTPCFVKQLGARPGEHTDAHEGYATTPRQWIPLTLRDRKGGNPSEWPDDLRVREVPR